MMSLKIVRIDTENDGVSPFDEIVYRGFWTITID